MMRAAMLGSLSLTLGFAAGDPQAASCRAKIDQIESGRARANAVYEFSAAEINAYAREELPQIVPHGLRSPTLELAPNTAIGSALIDFLQMEHGKGAKMNWLIEKFIEGERPVRVTIESQSKDGRAIIYIKRFEISGIAANAIVLDFLVRNFFRPLYPEAHINEWFNMGYNIDHVDVTAESVRVYIKSKLSKLPPKPPAKNK
jgi:hypothetical protein